MSLPLLFLALAGAALVGALTALFLALRAALGGGPTLQLAAEHEVPGRAALVDEKNALLRAIKDLEYERAVGKIGESDFERLNASYRARAKEVLAMLEVDLKPFMAQAEALLGAKGVSPKSEAKSSEPASKSPPKSSRPKSDAKAGEREPGQSEPGQSEPGQSEPGQSEPAKSEPAPSDVALEASSSSSKEEA
jgi:hypothetical protein